MPATSQHNPRFTNNSPNFAFSDATRMSAINASSIPQPTAAPLTAAITGTSVRSSASAAGVKFVGPKYHFHSGKEHRGDFEKAVFSELKGPPPTI